MDQADGDVEAGPPPDAATAPVELAVGDAGLMCTVVPVSVGDASPEICAFVMTCAGGGSIATLDARCLEGNAMLVNCAVDGNELNTFTKLGTCDCSDVAWLAPFATQCMP